MSLNKHHSSTSCFHRQFGTHYHSMLLFLFMVANLFPPFSNPLSFNITRFDQNQILLEGDGRVSSGAVHLNMDYYYRMGRVSYLEPLQLWDSSTGAETDFTTRFSFTIDTSNREFTGDGLVFFLAPLDYQIPQNSAGGGFGLLNGTTSLTPSLIQVVMVEFDTFPNTESIDPPEQHVGINKNSIDSLVYKSWNASSHSGKPAHVFISYNASLKNLSVSWTYDPVSISTSNSTNFLSSILDLKEVLPERVSFGFSAATGLHYETHIINSWEFSSNLEATKKTVTVNSNVNKKGMKNLAAIVVLVSLFIGASLSAIVWLVIKKKREEKSNVVFGSVKTDLEGAAAALPKRFSYQELVTATKGFADDRRLGRGGSGQVYKATLNDIPGQVVAVKRIFGESQQSERIFINEVNIISRLIHRNLVKFLGWCHEQNELLIVYEYMPNGSLDTHLFGKRKSLPWDVRYKIALGLASALHYLHEDAEKCVLHRDIKSANVLLDTDFSVKLGDFGVAKLVDTKLRTQKTTLVGTFGYLAPEYLTEGRATKESDMYSFGVVALEIACGRRTYQAGEHDHVPLMRWVWDLYLEGKIMEAADERLNMMFDQSEMKLLLMVGLWCTHPREKQRPKASQVIRVLQFDSQVPDLDPEDRHINIIPPQQVSSSVQTEITSSIRNNGR